MHFYSREETNLEDGLGDLGFGIFISLLFTSEECDVAFQKIL